MKRFDKDASHLYDQEVDRQDHTTYSKDQGSAIAATVLSLLTKIELSYARMQPTWIRDARGLLANEHKQTASQWQHTAADH